MRNKHYRKSHVGKPSASGIYSNRKSLPPVAFYDPSARKICKGFLMQCSLYLIGYKEKFPVETNKIHFVLSLLTGRALKWAASLWHQDNDVLKESTNFHGLFIEVFNHPAASCKAGNRSCEIQQERRSAADYALEFRTLAANSGWNDAALLTMQQRGLRPEFQSELACCADGNITVVTLTCLYQ